MDQSFRTLPVGRILRFLLGALFLAWALPPRGTPLAAMLPAVGVALALLAFYVLIHLGLARRSGPLRPALGLLIAIGPPALVFALGLPGGPIFGHGEGAVGMLLYIGVSLVVMALRADPGCETTALPNALFRRPVYLPCILFSPIDAIERRLRT